MICASVISLFLTVGTPNSFALEEGALLHTDFSGAMALYDSLLAQRPDDADVLWRMERVTVLIGDMAPAAGREEYYRRAESFARRSLAADSTLPDGHAWLAAALGQLSPFEGPGTKVRYAHEIKLHLDAALRLNPDDDAARFILGSYYHALGQVEWWARDLASVLYGGLPPGGFTEAEPELQRAIALAPQMIRYRHELALLYLDMNRKEEARWVLQEAASLTPCLMSDSLTLHEIETLLASLD